MLKKLKIPLIWIGILMVGMQIFDWLYPDPNLGKHNPRLAVTVALVLFALLIVPMFWITGTIAKHLFSPHNEANVPASQKRVGFIAKKEVATFFTSFFNTFLGREPLVIESAYDVETSIQRLQARAGGYLYLLRRGFRATLMGHAGRDVVRLTYFENLMSGPFKPIFRGRIQEQDQVVVLKGHLSFSWFARILLVGCALLFLYLILCFIIIPTGGEFSRGKAYNLPELIGGTLLMLIFITLWMTGLIAPWLRLGSRSRVGLVNSIKKALHLEELQEIY